MTSFDELKQTQQKIEALETLFGITLDGLMDKINEIRRKKGEPTALIVPGISILGIPLELRDNEPEVRIRYFAKNGSAPASLTLAAPIKSH